jgi:pyridoxal phosphate enzyme (YggS family)
MYSMQHKGLVFPSWRTWQIRAIWCIYKVIRIFLVNDQFLTKEQIESNYQAVLARVRRAAEKSGRNIDDIKLVVVSKTKSIRTIENAIKAGIHIFGENYADQAIPKITAIRHSHEISWHMIGHVQSRKASKVVEYFDYMHSLDNLKLARRLDGFTVKMINYSLL